MVPSLRVEDGLDGATNIRSLKTRILLLEENELQDHVKEVILEPEGVEEKAKYKENEAKAKRAARMKKVKCKRDNIGRKDITSIVVGKLLILNCRIHVYFDT